MRLILMVAFGLVCSVPVTGPAHYHRVMAPYLMELAKQCPTKHLELLAPADLQDALAEFKSALPKKQQACMARAERLNCAHIEQGTSCLNVGDLDVANRLELTNKVATNVCASFKECLGQSNCTAR